MTKKNWSCSVRVESVLSFRRLIKARQGGGIPPILWLCAYNYRGFLLWYPGHRFRPGWKRLSCCVLSLHFYVPTCLREYLPHTLYNDQRPAFLASASLFLGLIVAYLGSSERYFGGTKLISGRGENRSGCVGEERILGSLAAREVKTPFEPVSVPAKIRKVCSKLGSLRCCRQKCTAFGNGLDPSSVAKTLFFLSPWIVKRLIHAGEDHRRVK